MWDTDIKANSKVILEIDYFTAKGLKGILGRKIVLLVSDDKGKPPKEFEKVRSTLTAFNGQKWEVELYKELVKAIGGYDLRDHWEQLKREYKKTSKKV